MCVFESWPSHALEVQPPVGLVALRLVLRKQVLRSVIEVTGKHAACSIGRSEYWSSLSPVSDVF